VPLYQKTAPNTSIDGERQSQGSDAINFKQIKSKYPLRTLQLHLTCHWLSCTGDHMSRERNLLLIG